MLSLQSSKIPSSQKKKMKMKRPSLTRPPSNFSSPKVVGPNLLTQEGALKLALPNLS
jgi:hypothetical protein